MLTNIVAFELLAAMVALTSLCPERLCGAEVVHLSIALQLWLALCGASRGKRTWLCYLEGSGMKQVMSCLRILRNMLHHPRIWQMDRREAISV